MPYFYVSRCKKPHPFVNHYATAGVIDAPDLEAAKTQLAAMLKGAAEKGLDSADAYEVQALDGIERSENGAVTFTFVSR